MRTTLKYVLATAAGTGALIALLLAAEAVPYGTLWFIAIGSGVLAYIVCRKLGWLALVLIPSFPFLIISLELDRGYGERFPFGIAITAWLIFALGALAGAWRWWKGPGKTTPGVQ